jgi:hypothetical protein
MSKPITATQKRRARHPQIKNGTCTRCGLGERFLLGCPPGFWMNKAEWAAWMDGERFDGATYAEEGK